MTQREQRFQALLAAQGLRLTTPRLAVFQALGSAEEALSLNEISLRTPGADRATIYRTLTLLIHLGIAQLVANGFKRRYELATPFHAHHHHINCDRCGAVISFDSSSLEALIQRIAEQKGVHLHTHTLELVGCCDSCRDRDDLNLTLP